MHVMYVRPSLLPHVQRLTRPASNGRMQALFDNHGHEPGFYLKLKTWLLERGLPKNELDCCPDVDHLKLCMHKHGICLKGDEGFSEATK